MVAVELARAVRGKAVRRLCWSEAVRGESVALLQLRGLGLTYAILILGTFATFGTETLLADTFCLASLPHRNDRLSV